MLSSDFSWQVHHSLTGMVVRERLGRYLTPSIRIALKSRNMLQERDAGVQCICDGGGSRLFSRLGAVRQMKAEGKPIWAIGVASRCQNHLSIKPASVPALKPPKFQLAKTSAPVSLNQMVDRQHFSRCRRQARIPS